MWIYQKLVFSSEKIAELLRIEAKRFAIIDNEWSKIMRKASMSQKLLHVCCGDESPQSMLAHLKEQLELCQKSLACMFVCFEHINGGRFSREETC